MFAFLSKKIVLPLACLSATYLQYKQKYHMLDTFRANKPQFINALNNIKQQTLILVYNRESEDKLRDRIIQIQQLCEKNNISKLMLVDQTDIRHLQTFSHIVREDIEDNQTKNSQKQPVDLQGNIKIMYANPLFNTSKPFTIQSQQTLQEEIKQIRHFLKINPTAQQLKQSFSTFQKTSVLKNCYNDTCVDQYKEKVRKLIQSSLLRGKEENYEFFVTTGKAQAKKVSELIEQSSNKQQIYVHYNDILGEQTEYFTKWLEKQGNKYSNASQFMMMIRPRVYLIGKTNLMTDVYWYMNSVSNHATPTFSINATIEGLPTLTPDQINKLKILKEKFGSKLEVLVLTTTAASQLFRHVVCPSRYAVFKMTRQVPYSKMFLDIKSGSKTDMEPVIQDIEKFLKKPKNYTPIVMYNQKQKEINTDDLINILESGKYDKFVFRVCGKKNSCARSVYQTSGIKLNTPVFRLDGKIQNIGIDEGDYCVEGGNVTPLQAL